MPRFPHLVRLAATVLLCLPLLAGCASDGDSNAKTSLLPMTLAEWLFPPHASRATGDPVGVAHLSISPLKPGDNDLTLRLTDLDGAPFDVSAGTATLTWHPLAPDASASEAGITPVEGEPATWQVDDLALDDKGWYAFDVAFTRGSDTVAASTLYALLPDPSVYGGDAVDTPDTDASAQALYDRALASYGSWRTGRWRENLGSGEDVLVVTRYAVDSTDPARSAMESQSRYAAAFRPRDDGSVAPVQRDFAHRIAIADRWWSLDAGQWSEASGLPVASFPERADVYTGATGIEAAGTETIDGTETQVITFYLPKKGGQAEAWFAWWIDPQTGDIVRMAMIAQMHFMIWDFHDVNAPLEIEPPVGGSATPAASPAATPAGYPAIARTIT